MSLETIFEGKALRCDQSPGNAHDFFADATLPLCVMVNDMQGGRCWISDLEKDTYCRSLRRRLRREVAALDKVRTVKYYQFPQRPGTRDVILNTPVEDEDQTDVFMYRTNTRLSFKPFRTGGSPRLSRCSDRPTGMPYYNYNKTQGKIYKKPSKAKMVELVGSPMVSQNYQSFRPGSFLTGKLHARNSRYSMSQYSYNTL